MFRPILHFCPPWGMNSSSRSSSLQLDVDRMSLFKCHLTAFWNSSQKFIPNFGLKTLPTATLGEDIKIVTILSSNPSSAHIKVLLRLWPAQRSATDWIAGLGTWARKILGRPDESRSFSLYPCNIFLCSLDVGNMINMINAEVPV